MYQIIEIKKTMPCMYSIFKKSSTGKHALVELLLDDLIVFFGLKLVNGKQIYYTSFNQDSSLSVFAQKNALNYCLFRCCIVESLTLLFTFLLEILFCRTEKLTVTNTHTQFFVFFMLMFKCVPGSNVKPSQTCPRLTCAVLNSRNVIIYVACTH